MFIRQACRILPFFLLSGCTTATPDAAILKEAYRIVWEYPDSTLSQLESISPSRLSDEDGSLYRLAYSIAAYRAEVSNPYEDLSNEMTFFRMNGHTDYLFVAIVHQAQITGADGDYKNALSLLQSAKEYANTPAPPRIKSLYHSLKAFLMYRSGDYDNALFHYRESQTINLKEGFVDMTVSNAINMVNLPGCLDSCTLEQFISLYEPYVKKADVELQRKFYNNVSSI